ncbi:MAG: peptide chain release factor N(5)-glutamine methyltransferase [Campylobacter sp.]|nr:peptide chain release factor N(5)-glutamine methyltransferase [Campylobacter sp.]
MRVGEAIIAASSKCGSKFVARELMKFHLNTDTSGMLSMINETLERENAYKNSVKFYCGGIPLEYITGTASFMGRDFKVDKNVLIPRFETEILVKKTLDIASRFENPRICEIGVGSGIISITLKNELKNCSITATDISIKALEIAKFNADKFNADIEFSHTSLLDKVVGNFDIIISNPPYIKNSYELDKWVKNEPKEALFGGENGDEILKQIINLAKDRTKILACEIGYDQKNSLEKALKKVGFNYSFYKDLAGFDRGFVAERIFLE